MDGHNLKKMYNEGVRIISYPNGQRTELRMNNLGYVFEIPVATPEEERLNKINLLKARIARDIEALKDLEKTHE